MPEFMSLPRVHHHTGLESTGGATRVATLLLLGMQRQGLPAGFSFELAERADGTAISPANFGRYMHEGDIAHVHCTGDWPALLASIPTRVKTVITLHDCELFTGGCPYPLGCGDIDHGCEDPCPRNFSDSAARRKAKLAEIKRLNPMVVAPSRWMAQLAKRHLMRQVTIIPNGIPWPNEPIGRLEARAKLGIVSAAKVALFVAHGGMSAGYKAGDTWCALWEGLKARIPELLCFAVGGDKAFREKDLVLWPYVSRDKLALLMAASDVLLYPTRADNHSLVIMEAMAQKLPAVAYAVGGVPEQIIDQSNGVLVQSGDRDAFIDAASVLLSSPGLLREMSSEAFVYGRKRFSDKRMVDAYIQLYNKLT